MYYLMKKLTSFFVGFMSAMITLDLAILYAVTDGSVRYISWMAFFAAACFTAYWIATPLDKSKRGKVKKAVRRIANK